MDFARLSNALPRVFPPDLRPITPRDIGLTPDAARWLGADRGDGRSQHLTPQSLLRCVHHNDEANEVLLEPNIALHTVIGRHRPRHGRHRQTDAEDSASVASAASRARQLIAVFPLSSRVLLCFASGADLRSLRLVLVDEHGSNFEHGSARLPSAVRGVVANPRAHFDDSALVLSHTADTALVHRVALDDNGQYSLTLVDSLTVHSPPILDACINARMSSAERLECAVIDSVGGVYHWTVVTSDSQRDRDSDAATDEPGARLFFAVHWLNPDIAVIDETSFVRCTFSPHPRSLLVALRHHVVAVDLRAPYSDTRFRGTLLALPPLAAATAQLSSRTAPSAVNAELLPDFFFRHERYQSQHLKPGGASPAVECGEIRAMTTHCDIPFVLVLMTSDHLSLVDLRRSAHPLLEWMVPRQSPPQSLQLVHLHERVFAAVTVHAQRSELTVFAFEALPGEAPRAIGPPQRLLSFSELHSANNRGAVMDFPPPSLASATLVVRSDVVEALQLTHFGSLLAQSLTFTDIQQPLEKSWLALDSLPDSMALLMAPSDVTVPAWLPSSRWIPHTRHNLSAAFVTAFHGRPLPGEGVHCVDTIEPLVDRILETERARCAEMLEHPVNAMEFAKALVDCGLADSLALDAADAPLTWRVLTSAQLASIARACLRCLDRWSRAHHDALTTFQLAERNSVRHQISPRVVKDEGAVPVLLSLCHCAIHVSLGCDSLHCRRLYDRFFHHHPMIAPQLQFAVSSGETTASQGSQRVDLSQDTASLLQFLSQSQSVSQPSDTEPMADMGALDAILASLSDDWAKSEREWATQRSVAEARFRQGDEFADIVGGWRGIHGGKPALSSVRASVGAEMAELDDRDDDDND